MVGWSKEDRKPLTLGEAFVLLRAGLPAQAKAHVGGMGLPRREAKQAARRAALTVLVPLPRALDDKMGSGGAG